MSNVTVGQRISLNGDVGTVRWIGEVRGAKGVWLGVEWDDPTRGKHSGAKDGVQYFQCSVAGAGSFIRNTPTIATGRSFLAAFLAKYVDDLYSSTGNVETVTLGSSNGAIQVEAPDLNKVRARLANFSRLREISLDGELVSSAGSADDLHGKLPAVRGLDLGLNLLARWNDVAEIVVHLPSLQSLSLNGNRLQPLTHRFETNAFGKLQALRLNHTMITWSQFALLCPGLPQLEEVELGHNNLDSLTMDTLVEAPRLKTLQLGSNALSDWRAMLEATRCLPALSRLVVSSNKISEIPQLTAQDAPLPNIVYLGLSENQISSWRDIDALSTWLPRLSSLSCSKNPLIDGTSFATAAQFLIPRLPSLGQLNGGKISSAKRQDAELFYLSAIARETFANEQERLLAHPRWTELCQKYGEPAADRPADTSAKLGDKLVAVSLLRLNIAPARVGVPSYQEPPVELRVLKTMSVRVFGRKVAKTLGFGVKQRVRLWLLVEGEQGTGTLEIEEGHDLEWSGVEADSRIGVLAV